MSGITIDIINRNCPSDSLFGVQRIVPEIQPFLYVQNSLFTIPENTIYSTKKWAQVAPNIQQSFILNCPMKN